MYRVILWALIKAAWDPCPLGLPEMLIAAYVAGLPDATAIGGSVCFLFRWSSLPP